MMNHYHDRLLKILLREKYITETMCTMLEAYRIRWGVTAYDAVLDASILTEAELAHAVAATSHLPRIYSLKDAVLADQALKVVSFARARACAMIPLKQDDGGVELVIADPTQVDIIDELEAEVGSAVKLAVAERSEIERAIDQLYPLVCGWTDCTSTAK